MNTIVQDRLEHMKEALTYIENAGIVAKKYQPKTLEDALSVINDMWTAAHLAVSQDDGLEDIQPSD